MENKRKIVIHSETNSVGTDSWDFIEVDVNTTDKELDDLAWEYALNNAESYGIYPPSDADTDEDGADDNIGGCWYDYVPEDHDIYTCSGVPSFQEC